MDTINGLSYWNQSRLLRKSRDRARRIDLFDTITISYLVRRLGVLKDLYLYWLVWRTRILACTAAREVQIGLD